MNQRLVWHSLEGLQGTEDAWEIDPQKIPAWIIDQVLVLLSLQVVSFYKLVSPLLGDTMAGPLIEGEIQNVKDLPGDKVGGGSVGIRCKVAVVFFPDPGQFAVIIHGLIQGRSCISNGEEAGGWTDRNTMGRLY